jgi:hypothetical protein
MKETNKTLIALGAGLAIGSLLGVFFAPRKGSETRKLIVDKKNKMSDTIKEQTQKSKEALLSFKQNVKEKIDGATEKAEEFL